MLARVRAWLTTACYWLDQGGNWVWLRIGKRMGWLKAVKEFIVEKTQQNAHAAGVEHGRQMGIVQCRNLLAASINATPEYSAATRRTLRSAHEALGVLMTPLPGAIARKELQRPDNPDTN